MQNPASAFARRLALLAALLVPLFTFAAESTEPTDAKYRGFTLDDSRVKKMPELAAMRAATKEQIDIVHAVGLPDELLKFCQSVPFRLVPADKLPSKTPGLYSVRDHSVNVSSGIVNTGHKPVLLHELMHAYHDLRLKDGFKNRDVAALYTRAKTLDAYAAKSHMMENDREFFACSATTYLFGVTAQEPFRREKLKASQPEVIAFLKPLFGEKAGSYAGSLTR